MDPAVVLETVDLPGTAPLERFHVAYKATDLGGGDFHYEYALHNLNSDRSARRFTVSFPGAATITNVGFHDIDHHSGEPYGTADWTADLSVPGEVTWSTDPYWEDPDANALRWGTMFNFWFDADAGPGGVTYGLGEFKPMFADGFELGDTGGWSSTVGD